MKPEKNQRQYKIALDVRGSQPGFKEHLGRGIGRYILEVTPRLPALMPEADLTLIYDARYEMGRLATIENVTGLSARVSIPLPGKQELLRGHLGLLPLLRRAETDIVLHFCHEDAVIGGPRSAAFVYDLIPDRFPELYRISGNLKNRTRAKIFRFMARRLDTIFTISENSSRDLVELWRVPPDKIINVSAAIDSGLFYKRDPVECRMAVEKYSLPQNYFLYVGGIDPRKNVSAMLKAFKSALAGFPEMKLAMVGKMDIRRELAPLRAEIDALGISENIKLIGYVPDEDLPFLYGGSEALVFPSLYEGFGLPVLEALACGIPVIAGRINAIREAAGTTAIYCDVEEPSAIAGAMIDVWRNEVLRKKFAFDGPRQAAQFNWDSVASKVAAGLKGMASAL